MTDQVRTEPVYRQIAAALQSYRHCSSSAANESQQGRWRDRAESLVRNHMPSGSGIDCGTVLDLESSTSEKLVFVVEFHHMNDGGYYNGWTSHRVTVRPSLVNYFNIAVSGPNRNGIKGYLAEVYDSALSAVVPVE